MEEYSVKIDSRLRGNDTGDHHSVMETKEQVILVIDDSPSNIKVLVDTLKAEGFSTAIARNGETGLQRAEMLQPTLILLDVMMPEMDGFETCRRLKAKKATKEIPVIFMTALDSPDDKLTGLSLGAVDYVTKPFQVEEVLARVRIHHTLRQLQNQLQEENLRFRILEEATFEGLLIHEQGRILELNETLAAMFAYRRDEILGKALGEFLTRDSQRLVQRQLTVPDDLPHNIEGIAQDGSTLQLQIQGKSMPFKGRDVRVVAVRDIGWRQSLESENLSLRATLQKRDRFGKLIGRSLNMQKVYERITKAASSTGTVIIYGETGTGKELAAQTIFDLGDEYKKVFIPFNCGAITESLFESQLFGYKKGAFTGADRDTPGYFERAEGGTLFLDEIGELSPAMQTKLLRVLNDKSYTRVGDTRPRKADVRIIAATNKNLRELSSKGKFREDLFYRLHVLALDLPALRQRKDDIPLLIQHFLKLYTPEGRSAPEIPEMLFERFLSYEWPGNVRELGNEVYRFVTTGEPEFQGHLPRHASDGVELTKIRREGRNFQEIIEEVERQVLAEALIQYDHNRENTAEALQLPIRSLYRKIKKYGL